MDNRVNRFQMSRLEPEDKLTFLKLIHENKELLFAKTSPDTVKAKAECWEKVRAQCIAMGHTEFASKSAQFLRETTWQNLRRRAMAKLEKSVKAGSQVQFSEIDHLVFQIVGFNADGLDASALHGCPEDDESKFIITQGPRAHSSGTSSSSPELIPRKHDNSVVMEELSFGNAVPSTSSRRHTAANEALNGIDQTLESDSFHNTIMELLKSAQLDSAASAPLMNGTAEASTSGSATVKRRRLDLPSDSNDDLDAEEKRMRLQKSKLEIELLREQRQLLREQRDLVREQIREAQLKNRLLELDVHERELQVKNAADL